MAKDKTEQKKEHRVSEKKVRIVSELSKLIDRKNTLLVASTYNLSSSQLQEIRKKLRAKGEVKFVKKNVALRAIESSKREGIGEISKHITESPALILSDDDAFELATILSENKYPARAKTGQTAKREIVVEAGPTDLMPGPILTELGAAGLKAGIVGGKVTIKERQVLVKPGDVIPKPVSDILMKLEIMPFTVELEPLAAYDARTHNVYTGMKIDREGTLAKLKETFSCALQFAVKLEYPSADTIMQIITNAQREAIAMDSLNTHTTEGQ